LSVRRIIVGILGCVEGDVLGLDEGHFDGDILVFVEGEILGLTEGEADGDILGPNEGDAGDGWIIKGIGLQLPGQGSEMRDLSAGRAAGDSEVARVRS
jgi:hypothetical protein